MQYKLVTVREIITKVIRDLGMGDKEVDWQSMIEWIGEGMKHIGAYNQYEEKSEKLTLDSGRAKLPCDFYRMTEGHRERYKLLDDTIIVDTKSTEFTINYIAFKLDDEGFPLIPDNQSYADALFWKVAMQLAMRGEIPNPQFDYNLCRQKWNFYCRQARAKLNTLDEQEMALFARSFLSMGININQYPNFKGVSNRRIDGGD